MRGMTVLTIVAALLVGAGPLRGQTPVKLGYINSQAILSQDPAAKAAEEQFNQDMARYRTEVQQMGEEIQRLIKLFEQQQGMLSEEAKANRQEEIRLKQSQYQERIQQLEQQAAQRQAELVQPVMQRINRIIEQIRSEGNYTIIFDVAAQGIIAADPSLDLTQEVIRRLQAESGGAPGGTPPVR